MTLNKLIISRRALLWRDMAHKPYVHMLPILALLELIVMCNHNGPLPAFEADPSLSL